MLTFAANNKMYMQIHTEKLHGKLCNDCKFTFAGENKLKKHVYRIKTKDWFERIIVSDYLTMLQKQKNSCLLA